MNAILRDKGTMLEGIGRLTERGERGERERKEESLHQRACARGVFMRVRQIITQEVATKEASGEGKVGRKEGRRKERKLKVENGKRKARRIE